MSEEASTQGIQKSPQELYWEASGGRNRKGRVRGLGQGAELYYGSQGRGTASSQYTPSVVSQLQQQVHHLQHKQTTMETEIESRVNAQVEARMAELERRNKEMMDEMLSRMSGFNTPYTCSTFPQQPRDPRDDDPDSGGAGQAFGAVF